MDGPEGMNLWQLFIGPYLIGVACYVIYDLLRALARRLR